MSAADKQDAISALTAADASSAASLIQSVISDLAYYNARAKREELAKYSASELLKLVDEDPTAVLIAWIDGVVAGFAISRYDDGLIWLSWFGVSRELRRKGIGQRLLNAVEATAAQRDAHKIWCDTRTDNAESARVLVRNGFKQICQVSNHWYGQDFFLWEKTVRP